MSHELHLAPAARADIIDILDWSTEHFGDLVRQGYEALITTALDAIRHDPTTVGSRRRTDLGVGLRTLHLRSCRNEVGPDVRRIASPRHFVVYRPLDDVIHVMRLLHDAMDLPEHDIE